MQRRWVFIEGGWKEIYESCQDNMLNKRKSTLLLFWTIQPDITFFTKWRSLGMYLVCQHIVNLTIKFEMSFFIQSQLTLARRRLQVFTTPKCTPIGVLSYSSMNNVLRGKFLLKNGFVLQYITPLMYHNVGCALLKRKLLMQFL